VLLLIGSLPCFFGLALVMPILGHSTWHLYRAVVEPPPELKVADPGLTGSGKPGRFAGLAVGWVSKAPGAD
jgi:hypothetical protein